MTQADRPSWYIFGASPVNGAIEASAEGLIVSTYIMAFYELAARDRNVSPMTLSPTGIRT
jgi:hypothetical protein